VPNGKRYLGLIKLFGIRPIKTSDLFLWLQMQSPDQCGHL